MGGTALTAPPLHAPKVVAAGSILAMKAMQPRVHPPRTSACSAVARTACASCCLSQIGMSMLMMRREGVRVRRRQTRQGIWLMCLQLEVLASARGKCTREAYTEMRHELVVHIIRNPMLRGSPCKPVKRISLTRQLSI